MTLQSDDVTVKTINNVFSYYPDIFVSLNLVAIPTQC